jgi:hypothetical protein
MDVEPWAEHIFLDERQLFPTATIHYIKALHNTRGGGGYDGNDEEEEEEKPPSHLIGWLPFSFFLAK